MKVAIVSNNAEEAVISGYQLATNSLIEELRKRDGYELLVIQTGRKLAIKTEGNVVRFTFPGNDSNTGYFSPVWTRKNMMRCFDMLESFSPDVIHLQDAMSLGTMCVVWGVRNNIPLVYTAHARPTKLTRFADIPEWWAEIVDTALFHQYLGEFIKNMERVIVWNEDVAADVKKLYADAKTHILKNAIYLDEFLAQPITQLSQELHFCFIGRYSPLKNQKFLIDIFQHLPYKFKLHCYGPVQRNIDYFRSLQTKIEKEKITNVLLHEAVPKEDIPDILSKTHWFISVSELETHSLVVTEALASGTPVIVRDAHIINPIVDTTVGFDFPATLNPEEFAHEIVSELDTITEHDYQRLAQNSREKVKEYDWKEVISSYDKLYEDVVKSYASEHTPTQVDKFINLITLKRLRVQLEKMLGIKMSAKTKKRRLGIMTIFFFFSMFVVSIWMILSSFRRKSSKS